MELDPSKIDPKHLKISFLPRRKEMSRRDLLLGLLKPHYKIVPAVEEDRCLAWRGCSLCLESCPQEAISLKEESASVDKDKCTACGACLPSCPEEAISSPLLDPEVLDASLQSLLCRGETDLQPKVLVITSEDSDTLLEITTRPLSPEPVKLKLPCIGALSPWLMLRAFDLGADGFAIIPCASTCRHRCRPEAWQRIIRFVQALLIKLGMEAERVRLFSVVGPEPQSLSDSLQAFLEEVKEMAPTKLRNGEEIEEKVTLVALLNSLAERFDLGGACLSGDNVPFGFLKVEAGDRACTLCGSCAERCPTGALTLKEKGGSSQLLFDHSRCIACEACVKVCPERVLRMEKRVDFFRLGETTVLTEDRMARCRKCGKEIAPLAMMRKIQDQLAGRKASTPTGLSEFCPDCRIFGSL